MRVEALEGARAKIDRAKQHFEQLKSEIASDGAADRYGLFFLDDFQTREHIVTFQMPKHLSIRYGILAGEVIGQVRSALEHAVWELVPRPVEGKTGFPVIWEQSKYQDKKLVMIDGINNSAATAIERVQPFNSGGDSAPLYVLNETWKRDKHRVLNLVGQTVLGFQRVYIFPDKVVRQIPTTISGKLEDGAEVARFDFPDFYAPPKVRMVAHQAAFGLEFWDAGPATGKGVSKLLAELIQFGELLIEALSATV
jgi:hypothetical protein